MSLEKHKNLDIENVEIAVETFSRDYDPEVAINYLRTHKEDINEFCLQLRERFVDKDGTTTLLLVAKILERLL